MKKKPIKKMINLKHQTPKTIPLPKNMNVKDIIDENKLSQDGKIAIPIIKGLPFQDALKLAIGNKKMMDHVQIDYLSGVNDLMPTNGYTKGTKVPFVATIQGNFAINPCTVNQSTLFRMIESHDVIRRSYETNVSILVGGIGQYKHVEPKIQEFGRKLIKNINGGLVRIIQQMWTASYAGTAIGSLKTYVDDDGQLMMKELAHRPAQSIAFTLDAFGDILDIYQYVYGVPLGQIQNILSNGMAYDNNTPFNMWGGELNNFSNAGDLNYPLRSYILNQFGLYKLNPETTVHYIFDRINGKINPYGYSLMRTLFDQWISETTLANLEIGAFARYANPLLIMYCDGITTVEIGKNSDGTSRTMTAIEAGYQTMQDCTSQSAIVLSGMKGQVYDVQVVQTIADFKSFSEAIQNKEARLEKSMLIPSGIYDSATSYAGMSTQNSIHIRNMTAFRNEIIDEVILPQIMGYFIKKNFGKNITDFGWFDTSLLSLEDQQKESKIIETLKNCGFISPSYKPQANTVLKMFDMPELNDKEFAELQKAREKDITLDNKATKDTTNKTETKSDDDLYNKRSITEGL